MTVKLVNLGLPKSGTTTLAEALKQLGWRVADHKLRRGAGRPLELAGSFVARHVYDGYFDTGDPLARLDPWYDALTEVSALRGPLSLWPQCDYALIKAMRLSRPDLLFVATWRRAPEISASMMRWNTLGSERLPAGTIPGLPRGYGAKEEERLRWIRGHYDMLRDIFGDDPRFLELRVGAPNAREKLSTHIGVELPWWGRANANPEAQE